MPILFVSKRAQALFRRCVLLPVSLVVCAFFGCGTGSNSVKPSPTTPTTPSPTIKPKFVYTGNQGASLSGFSVGASTGVLTPLSGFPLAVGANPEYITHDPQNRFLFVSDIASNMLHVYAIDASTGALSEVSPSPYNTMIESESVVVDPSGTHLYLYRTGGSVFYPGVSGNQLVAFNLSSTGVLSPVAGSPFPVGTPGATFDSECGMVVNATGKFLYLKGSKNLYTFGVDSTTGGLTLLQTLSAQQYGGIALDPGGLYLYVVGNTSLTSYAIDATSGLLGTAKDSVLATGSGGAAIAISPNGSYAYTVENNTVVSYTVSGGVFTRVGTRYPNIYGQYIAVDGSGSFVYVPQTCSYCGSALYNVVYEFGIASSTGALTPLATPNVASGVTPRGITVISQ